MSTASNMDISSSSYAIISETFDEASRDSVNKAPTCMMLNLSAVRFHDESSDVMSARVTSIFNNVVHIVLFPAIFFMGFPSNVVNLVVFFKHGLKQRINLCLFCLALMDLIFVTLGFLIYAEKLGYKDFATSYRNFGRVSTILTNYRLMGLFTGSVFSSQFVSAVIAGERCLCVVWPLRSSAFLKTTTIGAVLLVGILLIFGGRFVTEMKYHMVCVVDVVTGLTSYFLTSSEFYRKHKTLINTLDGLVYGLALPLIFGIFVIVTTVITALNLQKSAEFRKESSSSSTAALSDRNVAVTKMLIYLSIQFIVLSLPNMLFRVSLIFLPELSMTRNWANLYFFMIGLTGLCGMLSSSLNFLVYYIFGSKYRDTVLAMLC